ncbi:OLC1v1001019C1 [Oldenlandia corymbosa var. corymbosa]|uniref:protein-serine/threonine phosphatase n=1 Tax=Oldenlandia corymbosa var. corymbosa TaxID=529605 RepID=A0AAV1D4Q9_OLDCO|nr:OLC1v1001019C1 [Oldenlandia corymbosa var. corymbosa]
MLEDSTTSTIGEISSSITGTMHHNKGAIKRPTQPPGFHRQDGQPPNYQNQQRSNQQYIPTEDEWIFVQNAIKNLAVSCKSLENQLAQIVKQNAERPSGSLPSDTVVNPKGNDQEQAKAVTLRSGKQLNQPSEKVTPLSDPAGKNEIFSEKVSDNDDVVEQEQAAGKPGMEETQFPASNKEPQQPTPIPPNPEHRGIFHPNLISENAEMADTQHIRRKIITERGISEDGVAFTYIKHHGWETFSNPLVKPRMQIVQEFYGNFHTAPRDGVFVRGITVNCSTEAIRAIWKLSRVSTDYRDTIAALHPNQPLEQAVLSRLAKEGTSWEMDDQENSLGFLTNVLQTPDLNLWHHFICCNLMPTSYTTKVTYEMALLLYAIVTDTPFDAASVIRDQLTRCITDPKCHMPERESSLRGVSQSSVILTMLFSPVSYVQFCFKAGGTIDGVENEANGVLASILKVLQKIHCNFYDTDDWDTLLNSDVTWVLQEVRKEVLKACKIVSGGVLKPGSKPEKQHYWKLKEQLRAICATKCGPSVTHVISLDSTSDHSSWAIQEKRFLDNPDWIDASRYLWQRQAEEKFSDKAATVAIDNDPKIAPITIYSVEFC